MRIPSAILGLMAVFALVPFACSNQAEGQRCNVDNGNDDCESGLVCTSSRELGGNADICCPASGQSTSPECTKGGGTTVTGAGGGTTTTGMTTTGGGGQGGDMSGGGGAGGGTTTSSGGGGMGGAGGGTTTSSGGGGMGGGGGN